MGDGDGDDRRASATPSGAAKIDPKVDTRARRRLGSGGERLAASWLAARGYRILGLNWRCPYGELDVIAEQDGGQNGRQDGELVFVEVKTRRGEAMGLPEEAITLSKRRRLIAAAQAYLEAADAPQRTYRIDVIAVQLTPGGKLLEVRHYERAVGGLDE